MSTHSGTQSKPPTEPLTSSNLAAPTNALATLPTRQEQLEHLGHAAADWKRQHPEASFEQWLQHELLGNGDFAWDCMGNLDWLDPRDGKLRFKFSQRQMKPFGQAGGLQAADQEAQGRIA